MILIIDNTLNHKTAMYFPLLMDVVRSFKGVRHKVVRTNDELKKIPLDKISSVIISGSPLMVTQGSFVPYLDQFILNVSAILQCNVPIIGICFGCQLINVMFGGTLKKLRQPFCKDTNMMPYNTNVRFCLSYVIKEVSPDFKVLGHAMVRNHFVPCYIKHRKREIYGCLFHPEHHKETHHFLLNFLQKTYKHKI